MENEIRRIYAIGHQNGKIIRYFLTRDEVKLAFEYLKSKTIPNFHLYDIKEIIIKELSQYEMEKLEEKLIPQYSASNDATN